MNTWMSPVDTSTHASNLKVYVHHGNSSAASRPHGLPPWFAYCSTCLRRTCWRNAVTSSSKEAVRGDLNSEQPGFQHELGVMVRVQKKILPASAALRMKSTDLLLFDLLTATFGARTPFNQPHSLHKQSTHSAPQCPKPQDIVSTRLSLLVISEKAHGWFTRAR